MTSLLIVNANIVNEGEIVAGDVFIRDGRIEAIGSHLHHAADRVLDAAGRFLLPGMIDDQVHFREPGLEEEGDLFTESRAAVAGGITSFMDMPNNEPLTLQSDDLSDKLQRASGRAMANFGFYLGASNENLETIKALDPRLACGLAIFIGSACTQKLVDDPETLELIFKHSPVLIAAHCEDTPTILENEESYRSIYGDHIPMEFHAQIRSEEACYLASSQVVDLAKRCKTRLHVLHVSTARELELFSRASLDQEKRITAEVCPHYLFFSEEDYASKGALIKCAPAIKSSEDQAGLIQGLLDNRLDMIGSGHAPHRWADKQGDNYFNIPSGAPQAQDALLSVLEHYHDGILSLEDIVNKTSHAVARLFNIQERGFIREGYWADLVLVDLEQAKLHGHAAALCRVGWTPYAGYTFRSQIAATLVNGELLWHEGEWLASNHAVGQALSFERDSA